MKSEIKRKIETEIIILLNQNREKFGIIMATVAGDKIFINLAKELNEDELEKLSREISNFILLELDKLRKEKVISNLPILRFETKPKLITIEI